MCYSQFSLEDIETNFGITFTKQVGLFANCLEIEDNELLENI